MDFLLNLIDLALYVLIAMLLLRSVVTYPELQFNQYAQIIDKVTSKLIGKNQMANAPIYIAVLVAAATLVGVHILALGLLGGVLDGLFSLVNFFYLFLLILLLLGTMNGTPGSGYIILLANRFSLRSVVIARKITRVPGNAIVVPLIIVFTVIYIAVMAGVRIGYMILTQAITIDDVTSDIILSALRFGGQSLLMLIANVIGIYIWLLIIRGIVSWFSLDPNNPFFGILYGLTEPVLAPVRNVIPPLGFIDISFLVVFICLSLIKYAIIMLAMNF